MYIAVFKNNGKDYLRLMESYRTKSANGKISIRKRIIHNSWISSMPTKKRS